MGMHMKAAVLSVAALAQVMVASATTWYVATDGTDDGTNDGKSAASPFASLAKAAESCADGDTIVFASGTYSFTSRVSPSAQSLTIRSQTLDPTDVIFDGQGQAGFLKLQGSDMGILGITFQNARCDDSAAIVLKASNSVVSNCVFRNNHRVTATADAWNGEMGGGLFCLSPGGKVQDCLFVGNSMTVRTDEKGDNAARGGGGCFKGVALSGCAFRGNAVTNDAPGTYGQMSAGGGAYLSRCTATECDFDGNAAVATTRSAWSGWGGGVAIDGGSVLSDSIVRNNSSSCAGGGVVLSDASRMTACTVSNNCVNTVQSSSYNMGGGVLLYGASEMANCHVVSNAIDGAVSYNGGGFAVCVGSGSRVLDCLVEGNSGNCAPVAFSTYASGSAMSVVSNCVIRENSSLGISGAFYAFLERTDFSALVTDCWVVSNTCATANNNCAIAYFGGYAGWGYSAQTFRNCLFRDNGAAADGKVVASLYSAQSDAADGSGSLPLNLEYCTFADNGSGTGDGAFFRELKTSASTSGTDFSVKGCVFVRSGGSGKNLFRNNEPLTLSASVSNSYLCCTAIPASMADCGNILAGGEGVDAKFADEAAGDCRPLVGSSLCDAGGATEAWMGAGRRKGGPWDMGDGTFSVGRVGIYGVTVTRNNPHPRLAGGAPDIGCFEWWTPPGLVMTIR